jgi:excisionase family DNA binding protein
MTIPTAPQAGGTPQEQEEAPAVAGRVSLRPRLGSAGDPGAEDHPLMTVPEAARALRVSEMTVRRAIHAKTIPFVAVGRAYRVPRAFVTGVLDAAAAGQNVTANVTT